MALAGCGITQDKPEPVVVEEEGVRNPEIRLQHSLSRTAKAVRDLYAIRAGERPVVPADLQAPVDWKPWSGPLDEAGRIMANFLQYEYIAPDPGPPLPTVRLHEQATPAIDVLRKMGAQAGAAATVDVDPQRRILKVFRP